jgi:hypothetical protein
VFGEFRPGHDLLLPFVRGDVDIFHPLAQGAGLLLGDAVHVLGPRPGQLKHLPQVPSQVLEDRGDHARDVGSRDRRGTAGAERQRMTP